MKMCEPPIRGKMPRYPKLVLLPVLHGHPDVRVVDVEAIVPTYASLYCGFALSFGCYTRIQ